MVEYVHTLMTTDKFNQFCSYPVDQLCSALLAIMNKTMIYQGLNIL